MSREGDSQEPFEGYTVEATDSTQAALLVRGFSLTLLDGPDRGRLFESRTDRCALGSHASNDLVLVDPTVSRFHCEVVVDARGPVVRDLGSRNGTRIDGVKVVEGFARHGSTLRVGRTSMRLELARTQNRLPLHESDRFGTLYGQSVAMRTVFAQLERAARSDATVLVEGETGTGKEEAAESIHGASARKDGSLVVLNCGAIPRELLESELFGHEAGAFTGAVKRRLGAFEQAHGGTLFLDEVGELPLAMQPALLRVLEEREVRRVGGTEVRKVDVRVVAATNRDLRSAVSAEKFREDLYYRLAVIRIVLPPLRERPEDVPGLVRHLSEAMGVPPEKIDALCTPDLLAALSGAAWPGNVRELRNYLEGCYVFEQAQPLAEQARDRSFEMVDARVPYAEARRRVIDAFERAYAEALLPLHDGNVSKAARAAGIGRAYLHRLMQRHGIERPR